MCTKLCALALWIIAVILILWLVFTPKTVSYVAPLPEPNQEQEATQLNTRLREFLESKQSPLVPDTEFILELKHWKLLIAVSAIESQYCKRQLGYNCWGIGGDEHYRYYSSFRTAAVDTNDLIEDWQKKGKWLTVEAMNCSYVVPCSENWVRVVNQNLKVLNELK